MNKRRELVIGDRNSTFTLYRDYADVGAEMKQDFFESEYTLKKDASRYIFKISKANEQEGILGLSYGTFLLSVLMDRFNQEASFSLEEKEKLENSIIELLRYVDTNGFDLSPFGRQEDNRMLFGWGENKQSFIESLTWALSSFLYARRLSKDGILDNLNKYIGDITRMIAKCLGILLDNVICANGEIGYKEGREDYVGWGPVTGCTESSLYFTHSVCETFGDIEDTMLGNKELGIDRDVAYIEEIVAEYEKIEGTKKIKGNVVELFEKVCKNVGKNLYQKYESSLGKKFFYVDGSEVASVDQIAYSLQSPVLLNQIYVVLSLIYVNFHKDMKEKGEDIFKDFGAMLKNAVDMVYETYVSLENKGKSSIVNREYATFTEKHPDNRFRQYFSSERINVAILETLIIKAKAMIVTYVTKYPEREIGEVLNILHKTRS